MLPDDQIQYESVVAVEQLETLQPSQTTESASENINIILPMKRLLEPPSDASNTLLNTKAFYYFSIVIIFLFHDLPNF
jgi:hypothetical protein